MYSFLSLTSKFGIGAAVGITFPILALMGFNPQHVNAPAAIEHMRLFYILLPILFAGISLSLMLGYPLDEVRQRALRDRIEKRRQMHQSADDIMPPGILPGGVALASDSEAVTKFINDNG
jgi:GPH family glycoside/pentoside/hexuronide:cation symporter